MMAFSFNFEIIIQNSCGFIALGNKTVKALRQPFCVPAEKIQLFHKPLHNFWPCIVAERLFLQQFPLHIKKNVHLSMRMHGYFCSQCYGKKKEKLLHATPKNLIGRNQHDAYNKGHGKCTYKALPYTGLPVLLLRMY